MSVYVDDARIEFRRMKMCHMIADTLEELHKMADAIGVRRKWFQGRASFPHYDVCLEMRRKAINLGAKPLGRRKFVTEMRRIRATMGEK